MLKKISQTQIIWKEFKLSAAIYRVESTHPIMGPLLPISGAKFLNLVDRALAVVLAAKSWTYPSGHEIRVVHVPTGVVVFRKTDACSTPCIEVF